MSDLAAALMVAIRAHAGRVDKQGEPYLLHVLRVVEAVSDEAKVVAALHDVFEDSENALEDFCGVGLTEGEHNALSLLTRWPDETYADYIDAIAVNADRAELGAPLAGEVKLADLRDNLERIPTRESAVERWDAPTLGGGTVPMVCDGREEWDREWGSLKVRYEKAIATLEAARSDS